MKRKLSELVLRKPFYEPLRVLDMGCGYAIAIFELLMFADKLEIPLIAYGIDQVLPELFDGRFDEFLTETGKEKYSQYVEEGRLSLHEGSVEAMPAAWADTMDLVMSNNVFQYVPDVLGAIEEAYRVLGVGGEAFLHLVSGGVDIPNYRPEVELQKPYSLYQYLYPEEGTFLPNSNISNPLYRYWLGFTFEPVLKLLKFKDSPQTLI
ncbi:MAG: class I SAM-dependent methyltransferase [Candidatus Margulisiibacteriota bacterium]